MNFTSVVEGATTDRLQPGSAATPGTPLFQSFRGSFLTTFRDGQQAEFVAGTDSITGEVTKIEVKVSVLR